MTDVLGALLGWSGGLAVVVKEDGTRVEIAIADIVSGKPVPPRPPVRHRVSARDAQVRGFALFADLVSEPLGDWVLRSSSSPARRANSVLAMGDAGVDDPVARVVEFYAAAGKRPRAAVEADSTAETMLRGLGWALDREEDDSLFQIASVSRARRVLRGMPAHDVELVEDGRLVTARLGTAARGVAAYADDWVGFGSIEVDPAHRREGLGLAIMDALLEWGAERGATTAHLQVVADQSAAVGLCRRLGFTTHHVFRYLAASGPVPLS